SAGSGCSGETTSCWPGVIDGSPGQSDAGPEGVVVLASERPVDDTASDGEPRPPCTIRSPSLAS
ncbi:MAG: hypothetical protein WDZ60_10870, partial [Wenzhouxiangellaceae bacterium]